MSGRCHVVIMSGLGHEFSDGIIYGLANRLMREPGVSVRVGSFREYQEMAAEARALPAGVSIMVVGHSMGAAVAARFAELVGGREVAIVYGFDPAENLAADSTEYALKPLPKNVKKGVAWTIEGLGLGGGEYTAVVPFNDNDQTGTIVEKVVVPFAHTNVEEHVEYHLRIVATARRLAA